jgi:hypothetical protein
MTIEELNELINMATRRKEEIEKTQKEKDWNAVRQALSHYMDKWGEVKVTTRDGDIITIDCTFYATTAGVIEEEC